ncbi:unnamed protein product [Alternaria alternata]
MQTKDIIATARQRGSFSSHIYRARGKDCCSQSKIQANDYWVPNLSGIIKAGDEGLFFSALFANLQGHPGQLPLENLYDAFATELRSRPISERSSYTGDMTKFLGRAKKPAGGLGRSKSMSNVKRGESSPKTARKSLDLSVVEMGLARSLSVKRPATALVPMRSGLRDDDAQKATQRSWMKEGQTAKYEDGRMSVKITSGELASLSIILGSQLSTGDAAGRNGTPQAQAFQRSLQSTSQPAPSPYSQDKIGVNSILITDEAFEALQAGASLYTHPYVARTAQSKFLASLPSSREPRFHILATSTEVHTSNTLLDAIAALPFSGGLAPPRISATDQNEQLIDKVYRHAPHLNIFGPLYEPQNAGLLFRERERLGRLASDAATPDSLADKTARVSRYTTLLERLMALVPDLKSQDVLAAVQEAAKAEIRSAYQAAVASHSSSAARRKSSVETITSPVSVVSDTPDIPAKSAKRQSTSSSRRSPRRQSNRSSAFSEVMETSVLSPFPVEEESGGGGKERSLAKQVEQVLKAELPLSVEMVAFVARMVVVAWCVSVQTVAWSDGEAGFRIPDVEAMGKFVMA